MSLLKHKKSIIHTRQREKGSVLFIILIAVALFAALGYTVSQMMRGGANPTAITNQKAKIYAGEILDYARLVKQAVQNIKISDDCADADISFENPIISGYVHSPVADDECKIFNAEGGGISYLPPSNNWMDVSHSAKAHYGEWYFPSDLTHLNVPSGAGSSGIEITAFMPYIRDNICKQINEQLGVTNKGDPTPVDGGDSYYDSLKFTGTLDTASANGAVDLSGAYTGCYQAHATSAANSAAPGSYVFFQVLMQNN